MFLLLRLLILTWISESELGHINSTPLFCATRFWHAWVQIVPFQSCIEISSCVWYQMKEWKMPLNMTHIVRWNLGDNENISLIKRVSFFLGHTVNTYSPMLASYNACIVLRWKVIFSQTHWSGEFSQGGHLPGSAVTSYQPHTHTHT